MRVLYDYQIMYLQRYGGISRYHYELLSELNSAYKEDSFSACVDICNNYYFRKFGKHHNKYIDKVRRKFIDDNGLNERETIKCIKNAIKSGRPYDIIHPTYYYADYLLKQKREFGNVKFVITVHDMIYELFNLPDDSLVKQKRNILEQSDGIIAISQKTKEDLLEIYPQLKSKPIKVIYHGKNNDDLILNQDNRYDFVNRDYFLFVGNRSGYKNFSVVLKAFSKVNEIEQGKYELICAGGGEFNSDELEEIARLNIVDKVFQYSLDDNALKQAYKNAKAFIFPSKYEGFGLPILEAYSQDCPVILSEASCFPEIAGDASVYFNPENVDQLAEKILFITQMEKEQRDKLLIRQRERLSLFSWKKTAIETYDFYKEIVD